MKKIGMIGILILLSAFGIFASGTKDSPDNSAESSRETIIQWYQFQIEVADQVNAMLKTYSGSHPRIKVEATILSDPYWDQLKVRAAASDMPDVFMTDGYNRIKTYNHYVKDLSSLALTERIVPGALPAISLDGRIVGMPVQMSGWGIIYNKDIFEEAGLEIPATFSELAAVCQALEARGVTPFVNQYKDNWVLGQMFGAVLGKTENPAELVDSLKNGTATLANTGFMLHALEVLDLTLKYGQKNPLNDGWNEACTAMGLGKGAMMLEGIWVHDTIKSVNPDIRLGLMALPLTDNPGDTKLSADVNGVYHILNNGKNEAAALDMLNWLYATEEGQEFFKECGFIPALKGIPSRLNDVCTDANQYIQEGKTSIWGWLISPSNFQAESGTVLQEYILGKYDRSGTLNALDALWQKLSSN